MPGQGAARIVARNAIDWSSVTKDDPGVVDPLPHQHVAGLQKMRLGSRAIDKSAGTQRRRTSTGEMVSQARSERSSETRESILVTAERLFALHGVAAVSNRQISEEAGQSNNFAVGYHFGTKQDLILAIIRRHHLPIEQRRTEMLAHIAQSQELRDFMACLVRPTTEYLAALGQPTWYARFIAQVTTDPVLRELFISEARSGSVSMQQTIDGMFRLISHLPERLQRERGDMCRLLIVHICAEYERAIQEGSAPSGSSWQSMADALIDALTGLWLAPITSRD